MAYKDYSSDLVARNFQGRVWIYRRMVRDGKKVEQRQTHHGSFASLTAADAAIRRLR